jgi:putative RNA 2'-phosphotransferase
MIETKSRYLSFLLRHKPEAAKLSIDSDGWVPIRQIIEGTEISEAEINQIVITDKKGRYSFSTDGTMIRANQGHSTDKVKMKFKTAVPPPILYHGTTSSAEDIIMRDGLLPMTRHYVHLSADLCTAKSVAGRRRSTHVIFEIDTAAMIASRFTFSLSDNEVWLIEKVPAKFLKVHHD